LANNDNYDVNTFDFAFDEDGNGGFNSQDDLGIFLNHVSKPLAPSITESFKDVPKHYVGV
jgi:phage-related tail fiber protein